MSDSRLLQKMKVFYKNIQLLEVGSKALSLEQGWYVLLRSSVRTDFKNESTVVAGVPGTFIGPFASQVACEEFVAAGAEQTNYTETDVCDFALKNELWRQLDCDKKD